MPRLRACIGQLFVRVCPSQTPLALITAVFKQAIRACWCGANSAGPRATVARKQAFYDMTISHRLASARANSNTKQRQVETSSWSSLRMLVYRTWHGHGTVLSSSNGSLPRVGRHLLVAQSAPRLLAKLHISHYDDLAACPRDSSAALVRPPRLDTLGHQAWSVLYVCFTSSGQRH